MSRGRRRRRATGGGTTIGKRALFACTAALVALQLPATARAHRLFEPKWWEGKTLEEVAEHQRLSLAHARGVVRFLEKRPWLEGVRRDEVLRWHRRHIRVTERELATTRAEIRAKRRAAAAAASAAAPSGGTADANETVAECESGGDPSAVSADGRYRGKYQFDQQTWDAHAPAGWKGVDPAAAPEAVQDQAAANVTYDAWPNC